MFSCPSNPAKIRHFPLGYDPSQECQDNWATYRDSLARSPPTDIRCGRVLSVTGTLAFQAAGCADDFGNRSWYPCHGRWTAAARIQLISGSGGRRPDRPASVLPKFAPGATAAVVDAESLAAAVEDHHAVCPTARRPARLRRSAPSRPASPARNSSKTCPATFSRIGRSRNSGQNRSCSAGSSPQWTRWRASPFEWLTLDQSGPTENFHDGDRELRAAGVHRPQRFAG